MNPVVAGLDSGRKAIPGSSGHRVRVLKFGGSSFLELDDYRRVAAFVHRVAVNSARRFVVVVSAMGGTTGRLLEAARTIDPALEPPVQDRVLATGEMVSASLLRAALHAEGCPAVDLWAPQLGICSDENATRARIVAVDPGPIRRALDGHRVVVVTGAQAVDRAGRITMLGRNSSDLTAVALAAALGAGSCEIFSDVPGIYSADPYVVPSALLLPRVSYRQCAAMSAGGAKVLHWGAVDVAARHGVKIVCRGAETTEPVAGAAVRTASVVGVGRGATAVVGDRAAHLYDPGDRPISSALTAARRCGLTVVSASLAGRTLLAIPGDQTGLAEALAEAGLTVDPVPGLGLVSVVGGNGRAHRQAVALEQVDATVRALHARYHGPPSGAVDRHRPLLGRKRYSAWRSMLCGDDLLPRPGDTKVA